MLEVKIKNLLDREKLSGSEAISFSQAISLIKKEIQLDLSECVICHKKAVPFCRSHTIPKFILKKIASKGKIIMGSDLASPLDVKHGINNTLIFSCICCECDSKYFQEYEEPEVFNNKVDNIVINEIAIKNYLRHYYKRLRERKLYELLINKNYTQHSIDYEYFDQEFHNKLLTTELDISDAENRLKKCIKRKDEKLFYLIDEIDLPYETQIAYQGAISLSEGFNGVVNNLLNYDPHYIIEQLHIGIFPCNGKTKIVLFCEDGVTRLKNFYKPYKKLDLKSKLYVINYIILLYDEEWCVSGSFDKSKLNENTMRLIGLTTDFNIGASSKEEYDMYAESLISQVQKEAFRLKTTGDIYNFLEEQIEKKTK